MIAALTRQRQPGGFEIDADESKNRKYANDCSEITANASRETFRSG
jgi:hypothetical protein